MFVGAIILGIMIGFGLKDAKLIRSASKLESPVHSSDLQNVFVKRDVHNTSAPLLLKRQNVTRRKSSRLSINNATSSALKNIAQSKQIYKFEQARSLSSKLRGEIHQYWQIDSFPKFKQTVHIPRAHWETYKRKFEYLVAHPNSTKTFKIAFGGSSVTAGHDNFLSEAYPALVKKQLTPIFELLGVKLEVWN